MNDPTTMELETRAAMLGLRRVIVPSGLGDVSVRVGDRGGDGALLLLHGAAGSWSTWLPLLEEAARRGRPLRNVVAIDLPGWGDSGELPHGATVDAFTEAVAEVTAALGYSEWSIIGHSLGGHLALDLASRMPDSTRAVTLVSATGPDALELLRHPITSFFTLPWLAGMLAAMRALSVFGRAGVEFVRWLHLLGWLRPLAAPLFAFPNRVDNAVLDALSCEVRPRAFLRAASAAQAFNEHAWNNIHCPVLVIRGGRDVFVGQGDATWFDAHLSAVSHATVVEAGHFAHVEQPGLVLDFTISNATTTR